MKNIPTISIIVTALNEERNVSPFLDRLKSFLEEGKFEHEVLFVDDGSTDGTYSEALKFSSWPNLKIIKLDKNMGSGGAIKMAIKEASGEWYAWLPCDLEIMPEELLRPLENRHGHDVVVTYFETGTMSRSLLRRFLSASFTSILNVTFGLKLPYYNGLSLIKRELVVREKVSARGFFFHAELLIRVLSKKRKVKFVPIHLSPRHLEKPKAISFKVFKDVVSCFLNTFWDVKIGHGRSHHQNRTY